MRLVPRHWHTETWICSVQGHCLPAATVAVVRPEDDRLAVAVHDHLRLVRCTRCDSWVEVVPPDPQDASSEFVPPITSIEMPRRGKVLRDAVLLRIIAVERAIHSVAFTILAIALIALDVRLPGLKAAAADLRRRITPALATTGQQQSRNWLVDLLGRVVKVNSHTLTVLAVTAVVYAVVEGIEAVGLWRERRWAEYLTVAATAGFLPFEIREIAKHVTFTRVGALVVNVAILVWLVWNKHLFGVRGGEQALRNSIDWDEVLATSEPAVARSSL